MPIDDADLIWGLVTASASDLIIYHPIADRLEELNYPYTAHAVRSLGRKRYGIIYELMTLAKQRYNLSGWQTGKQFEFLCKRNSAEKLINRIIDGGKLGNYSQQQIALATEAIKIIMIRNESTIRLWLAKVDDSELSFKKWMMI